MIKQKQNFTKNTIALLAMALVLASNLLPFMASAQLLGTSGQMIWICTQNGLQPVIIDKDTGKPADTDPQLTKACPLCLLSAWRDGITPQSVQLILPIEPPRSLVLTPLFNRILPRKFTPKFKLSRAPPRYI
jgi:hypothetical protein